MLRSSWCFTSILLSPRNLNCSADSISARMQRRQKHFAKCIYIHCHWSSTDIFPLDFRITIELPCQPASKTAREKQRNGTESFKLANSESCISSLLGTTVIQTGIPLHSWIRKIFTSFLLNHNIRKPLQSSTVGFSMSQRSANSPKGCQLSGICTQTVWLWEACEHCAESQQEIWDSSGNTVHTAMQ